MSQGPQADRVPAPSTPAPGARRWLLFVHQLPSQPSNLRVTTWRRLQLIGAIPLKQAVYVLPDTSQAREAGPSLVGFVMGASTLTGVFVKLPAGALSDLFGRRRLRLAGALVFASLPYTYLGVSTLALLVALRFVHGSATAILVRSRRPVCRM